MKKLWECKKYKPQLEINGSSTIQHNYENIMKKINCKNILSSFIWINDITAK